MSFEPAQVFRFLRVAYMKGVTGKFMPVFGAALSRVADRTGRRIDELLDMVDMAKEQSVERAERLLGRSGILLGAASNEWLMGLLSRLLDFHVVRKAAENGVAWYLERAVMRVEAAGAVPAGGRGH